jgi:hypothetical protein
MKRSEKTFRESRAKAKGWAVKCPRSDEIPCRVLSRQIHKVQWKENNTKGTSALSVKKK